MRGLLSPNQAARVRALKGHYVTIVLKQSKFFLFFFFVINTVISEKTKTESQSNTE